MSAFGDLIGPLNFNRHEALNLRLHQFSGAKPDSLAGEVYEDTTIDSPVFVGTSGHLPLLAASETAPPTLTVGQVASVGTATRGMRADARFGLPGLATPSADGFLSKEDKALLAGATNLANNSTLMQRSGTGTAQVQNPVNNLDAVNLQTLTERLAAASQGISTKDDCRAYSTSLPAYTYNGTTKRMTANANGALPAQNGVTLVVNDRLLLNNSTTQAGLWKVIQVGSAGTPWIMERTEDFGGPTAPAGQRLIGAQLKVLEGNAPIADSLWVATNDNIVIDTTVVVWQKLSKADADNITLEVNAGGALQIKDQGVPNPKLAQVATATIKGRATAGTGQVEDLTATQAWGVIQGAALGETSTTAYRGDRGKTAYDHSQTINANPHNTAYSQLANIPAALDAIDGLVPAADKLAYYTGAGSAALADLTSFARNLLDDTSASAARQTLGVAGFDAKAGYVRLPDSSGDGAGKWIKLMTITMPDNFATAGGIFAAKGTYSGSGFALVHWRFSSAPSTGFTTIEIRAGSVEGIDPGIFRIVRVTQSPSANVAEIWMQCPTANSVWLVKHLVVEGGSAVVESAPAWQAATTAGTAFNATAPGRLSSLLISGLAGAGTRLAEVDASGNVVSTRTLEGVIDGRAFKANFGNGTDSTYVIPHGLGTADLSLNIKEVATNRFVGGGQITADATNITIVAGGPVASNAYRVLAWKH